METYKLLTPQQVEFAKLVRPELFEGTPTSKGLDELNAEMQELREVISEVEAIDIPGHPIDRDMERRMVVQRMTEVHNQIMMLTTHIRRLSQDA